MIAYDLDGTLFTDPAADGGEVEHVWTDAGAILKRARPIRPVCDLVRELHNARYTPEVAYVSGRTEDVRNVTEELLYKLDMPNGPLILQDTWQGYYEMVRFKAAALTELGALVYVGDRPEDRDAANLAGCRFLHAETFHLLAGVPPLVTCPSCRDRGPQADAQISTCGDCEMYTCASCAPLHSCQSRAL